MISIYSLQNTIGLLFTKKKAFMAPYCLYSGPMIYSKEKQAYKHVYHKNIVMSGEPQLTCKNKTSSNLHGFYMIICSLKYLIVSEPIVFDTK